MPQDKDLEEQLNNPILGTESQIIAFFKDKRLLEIINLAKEEDFFDDLFWKNFTDYFNEIISCLIYVGISYIELEQADKAIEIFLFIENKIALVTKMIDEKSEELLNTTDNKAKSDEITNFLAQIKPQITQFFEKNNIRYLSNFAYAYYCDKQYEMAIKYYQEALSTDENDVQLNLGLAQAQYETLKTLKKNNQNDECKKIKANYQKILSILKKQNTDFDILLAIAKIHYFLGCYSVENYSDSLIYVQKALEFESTDRKKRVYAYDWLSRIAYKTKNYSVAATFYEKIITSLIDNPDSKQTGIIHPRPKLHEMVEYLHKNRKILNTIELNRVMISIWSGIIVASVFGVLESGDKLLYCLKFMLNTLCSILNIPFNITY